MKDEQERWKERSKERNLICSIVTEEREIKGWFKGDEKGGQDSSEREREIKKR